MTTVNLASRAILSNEEVAVLSAFAKQMKTGQIDLETAAQLTGIDALILRKLVRERVLQGAAPHRVTGVIGWCDLDQARELATKLHTARNIANNHGILATEAAEKYKFHRESIYNWHKAGWVRDGGRAENGDMLFNEGDIAFARALANLSEQQQGKPVFPPKPRK